MKRRSGHSTESALRHGKDRSRVVPRCSPGNRGTAAGGEIVTGTGTDAEPADPAAGAGTGHPAVDAVLRSLENAARLAPAAQIAEYEAAHQVLQETLASIDG